MIAIAGRRAASIAISSSRSMWRWKGTIWKRPKLSRLPTQNCSVGGQKLRRRKLSSPQSKKLHRKSSGAKGSGVFSQSRIVNYANTRISHIRHKDGRGSRSVRHRRGATASDRVPGIDGTLEDTEGHRGNEPHTAIRKSSRQKCRGFFPVVAPQTLTIAGIHAIHKAQTFGPRHRART